MKLSPLKNKLPILLLVVRLWFASILVYNGFSTARKDVMYRLFSPAGNVHDILLPSPMTHVAKIIEIVLGLCLFAGLFTRISSGLVLLIMLAALVASYANIIDFGLGNLALARILFWFAGIFIVFGAGKWSADGYLSLRNGLQKQN